MIGKTVGKYKILDRLGRGGMGTVYLALDETLDREVAIKVLNPDLGESDVLKRFRAEAVTLARLNHPGIATIFELHRQDDDLLMVMEFVRGETFQALSDRMGPMAVPQAAYLCMQVLDALGHAHRAGVVHRDLKLANVMVAETGAVKVMDFGIARVLGSEHFTQGGYMMGTPAYMAPEQVLEQEVDGRADLYAVGVMLYRLLAGELPFKADTSIAMIQKQIADPPTPIATFRADLPGWCLPLLDRALAKSAANRFQTAEEFRSALAASVRPETLGDLPTVATPTPLGTARSAEWMPGTGGTPRSGGTAAVREDTTRRVGRPPADQPTASTAASVERTTGSVDRTTTVVLGRMHVVLLGMFMVIFVIGVVTLAYIALHGGRSAVPASSGATPPASQPASPASSGGSVPATSGAPGSVTSASPPAATPPTGGTLPPPAQTASTPAGGGVPSPPGAAAAKGAPAAAPGDGRGTADPKALPDGRRGRAETPAVAAGTPAAPPVAGRGGRPGGPPEPVAPVPGAASRAEEPPARAGEPARGAVPADTFPPVVVPNARFVIHEPGRGPSREREAALRMADGAIAVLDRPGGSEIASLPYNALAAAFITRSKQPRWRAPDGTEAGGNVVNLGKLGFLKSDSNWLILLSRVHPPIVIRLEESALRQVLGAIQTRTGIPVERYVPKKD
jgi:eukaryotic-like serine/threonine-protein kinase